MREPLLWWQKLDAKCCAEMPMLMFYFIHWVLILPCQVVLWLLLPPSKTKGWW